MNKPVVDPIIEGIYNPIGKEMKETTRDEQ